MPKLDEELFGPVDQVREDFLLGNVFQVGDQVFDLNEKKQYEIIEHGPNFVYCKGEDGDVYTQVVVDIGDINEVRQDKDIKDKEGTGFLQNTSKDSPNQQNQNVMHTLRKVQKKMTMIPQSLQSQHLVMQMQRQSHRSTQRNSNKCLANYKQTKKTSPRIPRKKGQPAGSDKHSDLYTDENPKGTIHGLKFATVEDAKASVAKIEKSGKKHAHKIQAAIAMEQRARVMGKTGPADVYRAYINKMKKKTKEMNEKAL